MSTVINIKTALATALMVANLGAVSAQAAVSADKAAMLKDSLTPVGAERAGNAKGDIPAWDGGLTQAPAGYVAGGELVDPFAADIVLYTISAQNYKDYAEHLTEGQQALFEKNPEYRMNVYPTRRSAAAPKWVLDNTYNNALNAKMTEDGNGVQGAYGGIPFPIPQNGLEAIWNHNLRWAGSGKTSDYISLSTYSNGSHAISEGSLKETYPYYDKDASLETFNGNLLELLLQYKAPTRRKGEVILVHDPLNQAEKPRQAWQYIPGQRRVRRAPTIAFDTPNPGSNGMSTYDDAWMFNGSPERYDWKLVGKQEIFLAYNSNKFLSAHKQGADFDELLPPKFINPDYERWEKHRVWVVEATLKEGKRHIYGKRRFFIDEDTWTVSVADSYDGRGELWRHNYSHIVTYYNDRVTAPRGFTHYDLPAGNYAVLEYDLEPYVTSGPDHKYYTPQNVRKISRR